MLINKGKCVATIIFFRPDNPCIRARLTSCQFPDPGVFVNIQIPGDCAYEFEGMELSLIRKSDCSGRGEREAGVPLPSLPENSVLQCIQFVEKLLF